MSAIKIIGEQKGHKILMSTSESNADISVQGMTIAAQLILQKQKLNKEISRFEVDRAKMNNMIYAYTERQLGIGFFYIM